MSETSDGHEKAKREKRVLSPLTKDQLPGPIGDFLEKYPVFVRLYVPSIVTVSLIVQIFTGRCS